MVVVSDRVLETGKLGRGQGRVSGQTEVAAAAGQISKVAVLRADQGAYATGQRAARRGRDGVLGQGWRRRQGIGVGGRVGVGRHVVIVLAAEFQVLLLLVVEVRVVRGRGKVLVAHQIHRAGRGQEVVVVVAVCPRNEFLLVLLFIYYSRKVHLYSSVFLHRSLN